MEKKPVKAITNITSKNVSGVMSPIHFFPPNTEDEQFKELYYPQEPNITNNRYFISNKGNIWDSYRNQFLPINKTERMYPLAGSVQEYQRVGLETQNGYLKSPTFKSYPVHRLVISTFNPIDEPEKFEVNHKDRNRHNCNLDNLEWTTRLENIQHAVNNNCYDRKYKLEIKTSELLEIYNRLIKGDTVEQISEDLKIDINEVAAIAAQEKFQNIAAHYDLPAYTNQYKKQKKIADKLTDEQVHEICKLLQDGLGYTKVADQLNIPLHIVRDIRYKENYYADIKSQYTFPQTSKTRVLTSGDVRQICEMLQAGKTSKEITSELHVSDATIIAIKSGKIYPEISKLYNIEPPKVYAKGLRDDQVHKICRMLSQNKYNDREIAKIIDCNWTQVRDIRLRTRYSDISKRYNW